MAAAGTLTSSTGIVAGTDPTFTLTQSVRNLDKGVYLWLKYTAGTSTSLTLTFETKCESSPVLTSTDKYKISSVAGTSLSTLTYIITSANAGNYKIPITLGPYDDWVVVTLVYNTAGTTGVSVANILSS